MFQLSETVKEEQIKEKKEKAWDPLDLLPPLCPSISADSSFPKAPIPTTPATSATLQVSAGPPNYPNPNIPFTSSMSRSLDESSGSSVPCSMDEVPYKNTRGKWALRQESGNGSKRHKGVGLFPLWEVPMGGAQGGIGFINACCGFSS